MKEWSPRTQTKALPLQIQRLLQSQFGQEQPLQLLFLLEEQRSTIHHIVPWQHRAFEWVALLG